VENGLGESWRKAIFVIHYSGQGLMADGLLFGLVWLGVADWPSLAQSLLSPTLLLSQA
jgi:hypothetical protein